MKAFNERLVINSDLRHLNLARNFILNIIKKTRISPSNANKIVLATDEALSNVMEHAYESHKDGYIDINVGVSPEKFHVHIINGGKDFDPATIRVKDVLEQIKQGKKRGLGIFLMRRVMEEVKYSYKNGQNHLILVKYLTL